ncbi:MAG: phenylacetate--CoA ligase family protein [Granulosicoccus sp.]
MTTMHNEFETQDPALREARLFEDFAQRLQACADSCPGLGKHLSVHALDTINDRAALETLPVLRKSVLMAAQRANPPFGGFVREAALPGTRIFMSPGPVWEPQTSGIDPWQGVPALYAAGIRRGDRVHNAFSYHLTPGGFILDEAARALGCVVFPAGVGNTEAQVAALVQTQASVYVGTPDYLQTLLDHAAESGQSVSHVKRALVSGGAFFPAMRTRYREQGIAVLQCYATADLGVIAYESATDADVHPGMVVNENLIVEILVPGTDTPVKAGEVGELVVTRLHADYPLVRFATGDLSKIIDGPSPCGRTNMRLAGWMGRADQRAKVRGMFVDPLQLSDLKKNHPDIARWRLVISRQDNRDVMDLQVTIDSSTDLSIKGSADQWADNVKQSLKQATSLNGQVTLVDSLPDDGVVVDDQRTYES